MTGMYIKVGGVWQQASDVYVKKSNLWYPVKFGYVRVSGVYNSCFDYDTTPPGSPEITLEIIDDRYIKVGVDIPGVSHDYDVKKIRVLVSDKKQPTSPDGAGAVSEPDNTYPGESWSNWYYNNANPDSDHGNTNLIDYKQYPPNPTKDTDLPGGTWYYVSAWAQDFRGNWSIGTQSSIWKPKKGKTADAVIVKEATFQAAAAGNLDSSGVFTALGSDLLVQNSPQRDAAFFYGSAMKTAIGSQGTPNIHYATIRVIRENDAGEPEANVHLAWSANGNGASPVTDLSGSVLLGTINKGENKVFNIPNSFLNHLNSDIQSFALVHGPNTGDFLTVKGLSQNLRSGEVVVRWDEAL